MKQRIWVVTLSLATTVAIGCHDEDNNTSTAGQDVVGADAGPKGASHGAPRSLTSVHTAPPALPSEIDIEPKNGAVFTETTTDLEVAFSGFTDQAGQAIEVQVLGAPDAAIAEGSWVTIGSTTSTNEAKSFNDAAPIFRWSLSAVPSPSGENRWPRGGLLRYRAVAVDGAGKKTLLPFFDSDAGKCASSLAGKSWKEVLAQCKSPFSPDLGAPTGAQSRAAALVSTQRSPVFSNSPPPYLSRKGEIFTDETDLYYDTVDAPRTLQEFIFRFGFEEDGVAAATYFNKGDLGIGREMYCTKFDGGSACFVRNYGVDDDNQPIFGGDPELALADAFDQVNSFATVAMVKFGTTFSPPDGNDVQFFVYNAQDDLVNEAQLDNPGFNQSIPTNCLNCHGGRFDRERSAIVGASFLPFDPEAFLFGEGEFTFEAQAEQFRQLNVIVRDSGAPPSTFQYVDGIYGGKATTPNATINLDWMPKGWADDPEGKSVYRNLYKGFCRTCHVSQTGEFAFMGYPEFKKAATKHADSVCNLNEMPVAEATLHDFWESPARAYLVNAIGVSTPCGARQ